MQSVSYYIRPSIVRRARISYVFLGTLFVGFAIRDFANSLLQDSYGFSWDAVTAVVLTIAAAACVRGGFRVFRRGSTDQNFLCLDDDGLTYLLWEVRRQWPWRVLPTFRVTKSFFFGQKIIEFPVPDAVDWRARVGLRPGMKVSSGKLVTRIGDVYDTPLDEIATRLNQYRDTATG